MSYSDKGVVGDLINNSAKLRSLLTKIKYDRPVNETALRSGDISEFIAILSYVLLRMSPAVTRWLSTQQSTIGLSAAATPGSHAPAGDASMGTPLYGKNDVAFTEALYRLVRHKHVFNFVPALSPAQFLAPGFAERKMHFVSNVITRCMAKHNEYRKQFAYLKQQQPASKSRTSITAGSQAVLHPHGDDELAALKAAQRACCLDESAVTHPKVAIAPAVVLPNGQSIAKAKAKAGVNKQSKPFGRADRPTGRAASRSRSPAAARSGAAATDDDDDDDATAAPTTARGRALARSAGQTSKAAAAPDVPAADFVPDPPAPKSIAWAVDHAHVHADVNNGNGVPPATSGRQVDAPAREHTTAVSGSGSMSMRPGYHAAPVGPAAVAPAPVTATAGIESRHVRHGHAQPYTMAPPLTTATTHHAVRGALGDGYGAPPPLPQPLSHGSANAVQGLAQAHSLAARADADEQNAARAQMRHEHMSSGGGGGRTNQPQSPQRVGSPSRVGGSPSSRRRASARTSPLRTSGGSGGATSLQHKLARLAQVNASLAQQLDRYHTTGAVQPRFEVVDAVVDVTDADDGTDDAGMGEPQQSQHQQRLQLLQPRSLPQPAVFATLPAVSAAVSAAPRSPARSGPAPAPAAAPIVVTLPSDGKGVLPADLVRAVMSRFDALEQQVKRQLDTLQAKVILLDGKLRFYEVHNSNGHSEKAAAAGSAAAAASADTLPSSSAAFRARQSQQQPQQSLAAVDTKRDAKPPSTAGAGSAGSAVQPISATMSAASAANHANMSAATAAALSTDDAMFLALIRKRMEHTNAFVDAVAARSAAVLTSGSLSLSSKSSSSGSSGSAGIGKTLAVTTTPDRRSGSSGPAGPASAAAASAAGAAAPASPASAATTTFVTTDDRRDTIRGAPRDRDGDDAEEVDVSTLDRSPLSHSTVGRGVAGAQLWPSASAPSLSVAIAPFAAPATEYAAVASASTTTVVTKQVVTTTERHNTQPVPSAALSAAARGAWSRIA